MYRFYYWMYNLVGFSRSQTNGFLIFLPLFLIILVSEPVFRHWKALEKRNRESDLALLDSLIKVWPHKTDQTADRIPPPERKRPFNPNTATRSDLERNGLPASLAERIERFRDKGGRFFVKSDLLKIYGMDSILYETIVAYIMLPETVAPSRQKEVLSPEKKMPPLLSFDINTADSTQLRLLKGIGAKLSARIIRYREALGGFTSLEQLQEVYKLDSTVVQKLRKASFISQDFRPRQININTAGAEEMSVHPYLSRQAARAIVAYRFQHGSFRSIDQIRERQLLDTAGFRKLQPYLKVTD